MKKQLFLLSSLSLALVACENTMTTGGHPNQGQGYGPENTGRNVRDRNTQAVTPGNQFENEADRGITQRVRQAVIGDDSLSNNAKNIKIITMNGVVTLRGVVNNEREKNEIARKAKSINGVKSIDNQLEVIRGVNDGMRGDNVRDMSR